MKRILICSVLFCGLTAGPIASAKPSVKEEDARPIQGKALPELKLKDRPIAGPTLEMLDIGGKKYRPEILKASEALDMEPDYAKGIRQGLELVYHRDYKNARKHFASLDESYPNTGLGSTVNTLIWQALMIENFDFRYSKQYEVTHDQAIKELRAALKTGKHLGWTHLLIAGLSGIEAIHLMRHSKYIGALGRAFNALEHTELARKAAPDFVDLAIADGMYNYWVTVVTKSSNMMPNFGDHRALGIQQLQTVESEGFFLRPAATLALSFSWIQEGKKKAAIAACEQNRKLYPNNVINNLLTGQAYLGARKKVKALEVFNDLAKRTPDNYRVLYYKGLTKLRMGKAKEAMVDFQQYLDTPHIEKTHKAWGHFRMGQSYYQLKQYAKAEKHYVKSVKIDGHKGAKLRIARMRKQRKEGKLQY